MSSHPEYDGTAKTIWSFYDSSTVYYIGGSYSLGSGSVFTDILDIYVSLSQSGTYTKITASNNGLPTVTNAGGYTLYFQIRTKQNLQNFYYESGEVQSVSSYLDRKYISTWQPNATELKYTGSGIIMCDDQLTQQRNEHPEYFT